MSSELVRLVNHYLIEDLKEQQVYQTTSIPTYPTKANKSTHLDASTGLSVGSQSRWEDTY